MLTDLVRPESFEFFARYFLAGFIIFSVRGRFVLGERPRSGEVVFEAIVLSLINQLIFLLLMSALEVGFDRLSGTRVTLAPRSVFFAEVLVLPAILGAVFGWNLRGGWNAAILRRLSMPVVHPTRRAYDFAFAERDPCFVIVSFQDGTVVHGYFGEHSLAASDPQRSDIFLERIYSVGDDTIWTGSEPARSVLLSLTNLRSIEFLPIPEESRDEPKNPD